MPRPPRPAHPTDSTDPTHPPYPPYPTHLTFFGGKGGVGKTTCAAAHALAEAARGRRVLLASSDPAHSLGDVLGVRLSARLSKVAVGRGRTIDAVEISARRAFARWLRRHRGGLSEVLEHGTWLDRADIDALLDLPLPGIDELVGLVEIVALAVARRCELGVVDTAPTGHTLRLLSAPDTVLAAANVLDALQEEHRLIRRRFGRVGRPEAADRVVTEIALEAQRTAALLANPTRASFEWVLLPERLSLEESADAIRALRRTGIRVSRIVVNRLLPAGPPCPLCDHRRRDERRILAQLPRALGRIPLDAVSELPDEPRGAAALLRFGRALATRPSRRAAGSPLTDGSARGVPGAAPMPVMAPGRAGRVPASGVEAITGTPVAPERARAFAGARLLMFGGKGGVGKTTVAAAAALRLARADVRRRVLLISTDPAHSVGDVLQQPVGDRAVAVRGGPPNLRVRELDAQAALGAARADLEAAVAELVDAFGRSGVAAAPAGAPPSEAASRLLDLAPPGIDELFGLLALVRSSSGAHAADLVVVDTAPTGHALRLLEMPETAREWIQLLLRMLLKYRAIARPGRLAEELVQLSKSVRELSALLRNPGSTRFIVVTRAADMPRIETDRLLTRLQRLELAVPAVIVNALTFAPGACPWCRHRAATERMALHAIRQSCRRRTGCVIIQTPLVAPPPTGAAALERWGGRWIA